MPEFEPKPKSSLKLPRSAGSCRDEDTVRVGVDNLMGGSPTSRLRHNASDVTSTDAITDVVTLRFT